MFPISSSYLARRKIRKEISNAIFFRYNFSHHDAYCDSVSWFLTKRYSTHLSLARVTDEKYFKTLYYTAFKIEYDMLIGFIHLYKQCISILSMFKKCILELPLGNYLVTILNILVIEVYIILLSGCYQPCISNLTVLFQNLTHILK